MAKLTGIVVAKFLAKQDKGELAYIERARRDFKKGGGKGKRKKRKAKAQASAVPRKAKAKSKGNGAKSSRPSFQDTPLPE